MKEQTNSADLAINEALDDIRKAISSKDNEPEVLELTEIIASEVEASQTEASTKPNSEPLVLEEALEEKTAETASDNGSKHEESVKQPSEEKDNRFLHSTPANEVAASLQSNELNNLINKEVANQSQQILKSYLKQTNKHPVDNVSLSSDTTLENIVIDILKPILSEWLNKNLPNIVQNVVEKEIKKLIPKDD